MWIAAAAADHLWWGFGRNQQPAAILGRHGAFISESSAMNHYLIVPGYDLINNSTSTSSRCRQSDGSPEKGYTYKNVVGRHKDLTDWIDI